MATFDIFNDDAFSVSQLSKTIVDIPRVPTQLGDERLFNEYGINKTTMMIERTGSSLKLVPTAARGGVGATVGRDSRKMIPIAAVHLPQRDTILADEVQGIRAFGSETEVESAVKLVRKQQVKMKQNIDLTLEHMRVGALKGTVVDADGSTVLWNLYDIFGFTQQTIYFDIATASTTTDLKVKVQELKRAIQAKLGGRSFRRVRVKCSLEWFDKFTGHNNMKKAWELWQNGAYMRMDQSEADFEFAGVVFQLYLGGTSNGDFIAPGEAYAYPEGVPGMFETAYAPADYMETVNTEGLPYYTKQELMDFNKGVMLESQTNPIMLNSLPEAVIRLVTTAS